MNFLHTVPSFDELLAQECPISPLANWTLADALEKNHHRTRRFPLSAFNHVSREVLDLEKSKNFYCDILGFSVIPRPPFDAEGYWLWGNNLNLHLIKTKCAKERKKVKVARIQHFSTSLPAVDHIAFLTTNIDAVREILDSENVYYKFEEPKNTDIRQIFLFDPDGNVIEIANCAPPIGEITCPSAKLPTQAVALPLTPQPEVPPTMPLEEMQSERTSTSTESSMGSSSEDS
jgi:catechol 2,3-dioxygenase-like lactoylglutathione lyase family enzyme